MSVSVIGSVTVVSVNSVSKFVKLSSVVLESLATQYESFSNTFNRDPLDVNTHERR
jgi:hypothetical protein